MTTKTIGTIYEFLCKYRPDGPWTLVSIHPDPSKGGIVCQTFEKEQEKEIDTWVNHYNAEQQWNTYFDVNPSDVEHKRASKKDISYFNWIHVDIDTVGGEDFDTQRKKIYAQIKEYAKTPTLIIDSGGGYQVFWRLKEGVLVNHSEDNRNEEMLEAYNVQMIHHFDGDRTAQDMSRIMRLPFTTNNLSPKKIAMGRKKCLATIVQFNNRSYQLSEFIPYEVINANLGTDFTFDSHASVNFNNLKKDLDLTKIKDENGDLTIIGESFLTKIKKREPKGARSEPVMAVLMHLIHRHIPDDTIASIMLDSENGISEYFFNRKHPLKEFSRQLKNAKDKTHDPILYTLNKTYSYVIYGGKPTIIQEHIGEDGRLEMSKCTVTAFTKLMNNKKVKFMGKDGKTKEIPMGNWWMAQEGRRTYRKITFKPNKETPGCYNLWQGFKYIPAEGNWSIFKEHIRNNICQNDEKLFDYVIKWMARTVQHPDRLGEVAIVLNGERGVGKTKFAELFGALFGPHYYAFDKDEQVTGRFNGHLKDCVICLADEAFYAGNKKNESTLKTLITDKHRAIEQKGIDVTTYENFVHLIIVSNEEWYIPVGNFERRFLALVVSPEHMQDIPYFISMDEQMDNGGFEAMLYDLLKTDLAGFEHELRNPPITTALREQHIHSMPSNEKWWLEKLMCGQICPTHLAWDHPISQEEMLADYNKFAANIGMRYKTTLSDMMRFFKKILPTKKEPAMISEIIEDRSKVSSFYTGEITKIKITKRCFPSLVACREEFDRIYNQKIDWPNMVDALNTLEETHQF